MTITRAAIEAAYARIAPYIRRTPSWTLPGAFGHDGPVSLKLEFLQHAGSFKTRGAFNTLLSPGSQRRPAAIMELPSPTRPSSLA
jgi:threonine dehydratase